MVRMGSSLESGINRGFGKIFMREVEIKAKIHDRELLLQALQQQGVVLGESKIQHDVVFCKPGQKAYDPNSVWLRIRTENESEVIFTAKGDTGRNLTSIEHEVEVNNAKELEAILRLLGYGLFSDIVKTRNKAKYGRIEICLDEVDGLGLFLEGEILTQNESETETALGELWNFFESLGVSRDDAVTMGYDILYQQEHER